MKLSLFFYSSLVFLYSSFIFLLLLSFFLNVPFVSFSLFSPPFPSSQFLCKAAFFSNFFLLKFSPLPGFSNWVVYMPLLLEEGGDLSEQTKYLLEHGDELLEHNGVEESSESIVNSRISEQDVKLQFTCDLCRSSFISQRDLDRHRRSNKCVQFSCDLCGEKYKRKDYLMVSKI